MSDSELPASDTTAERVPQRTTPTWEVELLISGAAIFAMLQLPGWLGAHILPLVPHFVESLGVALKLTYMYLASASVILAVTFALHLLLRAHWIALVGMHSVFPGGVRWERLSIGQVLREFSRRRDRGAVDTIERADNRATVVFAFGIMVAMTMAILGLVVSLTLVVSAAINMLTNVEVNAVYLFFAAVMLFFTPMFGALIVDKLLGHRLQAGSLSWRSLERIYRMYFRAGVLRGFSTGRLLESHGGQKRMVIMILVVIMPVILAVMIHVERLHEPLAIGSYSGFPHFTLHDRHVLYSGHYEDQRELLRSPAQPYIQSAVITGPYVKLVLPYSPNSDGVALRRTCPEANTGDDDARAAVALACLAAMHPVTLDGTPLAALQYQVANEPGTHRPVLVAMIDVRDLARGRHILQVDRAPVLEDESNSDLRKPWMILFWT